MKKAVSTIAPLPIFLALLALRTSAAGQGPSFSCSGAKGVAAVVCSSPALSAKDRRMNALYRVARVSVTGEAPSGQVPAQRQWLRDIETTCSAKSKQAQCISLLYDSRNDELAIDALFGAHDVAMEQLSGPSPGMDQGPNSSFAPSSARPSPVNKRPRAVSLYEAIYRYATVEGPLERRVAVTPLIAPLFGAIKGKSWDQPIRSLRNPQDAVASDKNFAAFLAVASVSIDTETVALPCTAVVRRPGLIDVLEAYYGDAIDGHLIGTTCRTATTSIPALDAVIKAANDAQESCPGTIRFSLWRNTERLLTAVRLHRMDILDLQNSGDAGRAADDTIRADPEVAKFVTTHQRLVRTAELAMTTYYVAAFQTSSGVASGQAKLAVTKAVQAIYDSCERG